MTERFAAQDSTKLFPISFVSRQTGVTPERIQDWIEFGWVDAPAKNLVYLNQIEEAMKHQLNMTWVKAEAKLMAVNNMGCDHFVTEAVRQYGKGNVEAIALVAYDFMYGGLCESGYDELEAQRILDAEVREMADLLAKGQFRNEERPSNKLGLVW